MIYNDLSAQQRSLDAEEWNTMRNYSEIGHGILVIHILHGRAAFYVRATGKR